MPRGINLLLLLTALVGGATAQTPPPIDAWERCDGFISSGGNIPGYPAYMTLRDARAACASIPSCRGFTYSGSPDPDTATDVWLKDKWDCNPDGGWGAFKKPEGAGASGCVNRFGNGLDWTAIPYKRLGTDSPWGLVDDCTQQNVSPYGAYLCGVRGPAGDITNCPGDCQAGQCVSGPSGTWERCTGFISAGGNVPGYQGVKLTPNEAQATCASLPSCIGYTYTGSGGADDRTNVWLKEKWDCVQNGGWNAFKKPGASGCTGLVARGKSISCTTWGDPHVITFAGRNSHPMGEGAYVLASCADLTIHSCHRPIRDGVSVNSAFAIKYGPHVIKILDGAPPAVPSDSGIRVQNRKLSFPGGEVVIVGPGRLTVKLPARCCGAVEGLCGRFSPDAQFQDIFTDAAGLSGQYPNRWFGGPYGGAYQRDFVESFRVPPGDPAALFTAAECPAGEAPAVVPAEPPKPFDGCPELEAQATAQCPRGRFYDNCVTDVGVTCDLSKWVDECKAAEDDFEDVDEGDVELPDETPECPPGGGHVDFEDLVGMDNQELPVDYGKNDGISFALVHTGTFDDYPNRPRLEAVGNDKVHTAFGGSCTGMNDRDHLGTLGDVFLRFPRQDLEGQYDGLPALLVTYEGETEEASGMLYDIDGRTKATEHFKVTAFDAHRTELVSQLSPEGTIRFCTPNAPTPNNLDSWGWQFTITAPEGAKIKYIRIDQVGTDPDPSFGFDNFVAYTRCVPEAVCDWDPLAQQRVICPNIKSLFNTLCRIECGQPVCPGLDEAAIRAACQTDEAPAEAN